jgi:hypothetical protein
MNFDYNVSNYSIDELIEILKLPHEPTTEEEIVEKQTILVQQIESDLKLNLHDKNEIVNFIKSCGQRVRKSLNVKDSHHNLIQPNNSSYLPSFPSQTYAGILNPLKRRTLSKNVNIDTRFRSQYKTTSATNFRVDFPFNLNNVVIMKLTAFEFPWQSLYNITSELGNNMFCINGQVYIIKDGFYTFDTLVTYVNSLQSIVEFRVDSSTHHMSIKALNPELDLVIDFDTDIYGNKVLTPPQQQNGTLMLKFGWLCGFRESEYKAKKEYTSESVCNLQPLPYLFLCINDYNNNVNSTFLSAFNESLLNANILGRISFSNENEILTTPREYFGPVNINALQINVIDPFGRTISIKGLDYSFCLEFEILYDL